MLGHQWRTLGLATTMPTPLQREAAVEQWVWARSSVRRACVRARRMHSGAFPRHVPLSTCCPPRCRRRRRCLQVEGDSIYAEQSSARTGGPRQFRWNIE